MPLSIQQVPVNFSKGLDLKTDPYQVSMGSFLALTNSVFDKGGLLKKRYGFGAFESSPFSSAASSNFTYLTTLNNNLTAIGNSISAYSESNEVWVSKGSYTPLELMTLPLIRNSVNQTQCDASQSTNGLTCVVYTQTIVSTSNYYYAVLDSNTGQNIVAPTLIPTSGSGQTIVASPRVFLLGNYFVILFTNEVSSGNYDLQYIAIATTNTSYVTTPNNIATGISYSSPQYFDGVVFGDNLYISYNTIAGGASVKVTYLSENAASIGLGPMPATSFAGYQATLMSICVDLTNPPLPTPPTPPPPFFYIAWYNSATTDYYVAAVSQTLSIEFAPITITGAPTTENITCAAQNGMCSVFVEVQNAYTYDSSIFTNYVNRININNTGSVLSTITSVRSVGLASKAFIMQDSIYFLAAYSSPFQPTYFLVNGTLSTEASPIVVGKLAYENGGGYLTLNLPSVTVNDLSASIAYLYKDLVEALAVTPNTQQTTTGGVYSQTGINIATFVFSTSNITTCEIASNLQLSGGFLWNYDGYLPVENNFFLYPDSVELAATTGGSMAAQQYYYSVTYEWTDNQGNTYRSAPSIPVTTTLAGGNDAVVVNIPTLRLTYKIANVVRIVVYRWSTANQNYYQVTELTDANFATTLNSTTTDSIAYTDTKADASIVGNNLLYTTGGVVEDVSGPASNVMALFDTRLWLLDAEDTNLLWYSKQVIESTPIEMSDLFTYYVAPTTGAQGSTGSITALAPMDDKLIIFKPNAIYYINGTGPDNTGSNSQYPSTAVFIASSVGCTNPASIVLTPMGLMFQSDKGIWLLGRDLSTTYIGAPVEAYNSQTVTSAEVIPETNQVRFALNSNNMLMYDYYYQQWGTFNTPQSLSGTLYNSLHTLLLSSGQVYQETPGFYIDGNTPVTMSFQTAWMQLTGLQGFARAYEVYLLGTYLSPHKLTIQVCYDYNSNPLQQTTIMPDNFAGFWGSEAAWGTGAPWGGASVGAGPTNSGLEQWRIFFDQERCQAVSLIISESFDPAFGTAPGAGLTLSGLNFSIGVVKGKPMLPPGRQIG
jgi:hypothetical protein